MSAKTRFTKVFFLSLLQVLLIFQVHAQLNQGGIPRSFSHSISPDLKNATVLPAPDLDQLGAEDALNPVPYRFAVNIPAGISPESAGIWETAPDGSMIWRITVKAEKALALSLYFNRFSLPEGGRLFVYNPGRTQLLGAFTSQNNTPRATFATGLVFGDELTVEYNAPAGTGMPVFLISEVGYAYRGVSVYPKNADGFGGSGDCEVNINCPEGQDVQVEKRGVARIQVKRGTGSFWCTGSLVNNTRYDKIPYLLTADHCGRNTTPDDVSQWVFYFNYESASCPNPSFEPPSHSMTGATLVSHGGDAGNSGSDFFMVRLLENIPDSFHVCFNGWSRTNESSPDGYGIHHPQGDIQKVSTYVEPLVSSSWNGHVPGSHWRVVWAATPNGHGVTEGGSSGSPIFDDFNRIVGTLTGGDSSCDSSALDAPDYYGKFSYHWDQNGTDSSSVLSVWLDPDSSGAMYVNPLYVSVAENFMDDWVTVHPNPAGDYIRVELAGEKEAVFSVTDLRGRVLVPATRRTAAGAGVSIDLSGLAPGIYILTVTGHERQAVRKVLKK